MPVDARHADPGTSDSVGICSFEAAEIGWLREEAIGARRRSGNAEAMTMLDVHRLDDPLLRVARHPRLVGHAVKTLGAPVCLRSSALDVGCGAPSATPSGVMRAALDLGSVPGRPGTGSPGGTLGECRFAGPGETLDLPGGTLQLVLDYARCSDHAAALTTIASDGLWPPAAFCAG